MIRITIEDGVAPEVAKAAAIKAIDVISTKPGTGIQSPMGDGVVLTIEPLDRDGRVYRVTVQVTW